MDPVLTALPRAVKLNAQRFGLWLVSLLANGTVSGEFLKEKLDIILCLCGDRTYYEFSLSPLAVVKRRA